MSFCSVGGVETTLDTLHHQGTINNVNLICLPDLPLILRTGFTTALAAFTMTFFIVGVIAAARRNYNATVTTYNNAVMMFPGNMFAGMLGYQTLPVLEATAAERENISAKELFNN